MSANYQHDGGEDVTKPGVVSAAQPYQTHATATPSPPAPASHIIDNSSWLDHSLRDYVSLRADCGDQLSCRETVSFYDLLVNHADIEMRDDILRYGTPALIIAGNLSNMLALCVLRRKKLRKNSVCFYMCAYALANLLTLNLMLGVAWLCFAFNKIYVTSLSDWSCRLWSFLTNVITYSGIWFVVAMSVDRLLYTTSRSGLQGHCSVFSAKAAVTAIMTGLVVVSIHAMWTFELQPHGCYVPFQQGDVHVLIWPWWSATVYTYLPLFLIFSFNVVHVIVLCVRHEPQSSSQTETGRENFVLTVVAVSMSFFLLAVPATVTNIFDIHMPSSWLSVDLVARVELTKKITELLSSLNQVVFGVQLLVCSQEFRRESAALLRMIFCCVGPRRQLKIFEMRQASNSEDSSPDPHVDYQLCNNNEETITSV